MQSTGRYRHKLSQAQVHAVMGKNGVLPARSDMFGPGDTAQLDSFVEEWAARAAAEVAEWPEEMHDAEPDFERLERQARRFEAVTARRRVSSTPPARRQRRQAGEE